MIQFFVTITSVFTFKASLYSNMSLCSAATDQHVGQGLIKATASLTGITGPGRLFVYCVTWHRRLAGWRTTQHHPSSLVKAGSPNTLSSQVLTFMHPRPPSCLVSSTLRKLPKRAHAAAKKRAGQTQPQAEGRMFVYRVTWHRRLAGWRTTQHHTSSMVKAGSRNSLTSQLSAFM